MLGSALTFLPNLKLAWQFYQEEKHYSHQSFSRWTQAILMVFIVTLSQTSDSVQSYLSQNLDNLLGADLVISQKSALNNSQQTWLQNHSQEIVATQDVSTTLTYQGKWQTAKLKAVGDNYPLQGELRVASSLNGSEVAVSEGPELGEIWLDSRLIASLGINVGDSLILSQQPLLVSHIIKHEPDRLMEGHTVAMRAMVNMQVMEKLDFPDDIVRHRLLFAVDAEQTSNIIDWQKENLPAAQIHHKQGAHPLALFWQRTENFIGLASIILFFMAAIAIEQLTHVQMRKEQYFAAVCMSLGASKMTGFQISVLKWLMRIGFMLPLVLLLSAGFHWLLVHWLGNTFPDLHWSWDMLSAVKSVLSISALFLIFQLPVWIGLKNSSVARLVNNTQGKSSYWLSLGCALAVLVAIAVIYSDNALLTAMVLISMVITIVLILGISWLALTLGEKVTQNFSGLMPFTLYMMKQRLMSKSTQVLGVGLCAFLLLFTLMLMKDLNHTMSAYQRQHDGNLFVSQASNTQMKDVHVWAQANDIEVRQSKPYMYAKLTKINGLFLDDYTDQPSDSMATMKNSIRLHWTDVVPANNRVDEGQWWQPGDSNWQQVSIEQEVMTDLGLDIGDTLTFFIGNESIDFNVAASHVYKSGGGSITFWVQMPSTGLAFIDASHYHMASLELDAQQFPLLSEMWQKHPSLRMVSLKELTERFDKTLAMVTQVISGFSVLIIGLAGIVILSSVNSLEAREKKKNSIIMSFGFSKETCLRLNVIEWSVTGSIAAIGAIAGTYIAGLLIYQSQFSLTYKPDFLWLGGTLTIILALVTVFGVYASKNSLSSSIRDLLAEQ